MRRLLRFVFCTAICMSVLVSNNQGADAINTSLRILPIGDSITWGHGSSDGNGYRLRLLNLLSGYSVTYLGHLHSGDMKNNNNEGYQAMEINEIKTYVKGNGTLAQRPNLVLILAGTNDINHDHAASTAPERLGSLIDLITTECPEAAVIVSEITPIWGADHQARVDVFNAALQGIVAMRNSSSSTNTSVLALKMSSYVSANDLGDGLHPTDIGYQKMANGWKDGIMQAAERGWLNDGSRTWDGLDSSFMFLACFWSLIIGF